jgi:hypothetical protein
MAAIPAAIVMMNHHPVADLGFFCRNMFAKFDNDPAGFVTRNEMFRAGKFAAIGVQICATHAGGLDFQYDVMWSRRRISKLH